MKRMGGVAWPVVRGKKFGNLDLVDTVMEGRANGYPCDFMEEWVEEYGPQHDIKILGGSQLFTADPGDVKFVLATEFSSFEKGPTFREAARSLLGFGVFNADGQFHRSMSRPFFNRDRISDFDIFSRHSDTVFRKITDRLNTGVAVDFEDAVARFAMDSASEFLFGTSVDSLHDPLPYPWNVPPPPGSTASRSASDRFVTAFAGAQLATAHRFWRGPVWKYSEITTDKTRAHIKEIDAFITPILQRALLRKKQSKARNDKSDLPLSSDGEETSLLDHLVSLTDDVKVIKDEIVNILVAGRDTTSVTLTFAVYFMAIHPDVLRRAREEVLARFGTTRTPSFEEMRDLKYNRAVINETLRLMPPVPLNVRYAYANKSVLMPSTDANGKHYYVAAGDPVAYSVFLMQRRKELWGPDAEAFDPDRFLDERLHKYLTPNPYIFVPFNAGPRICLGQQFAYNEMTYFLVKLLQRFDSIALDKDAMPPFARPPPEWKHCKGRKAVEQIIPTAALTLSVKGGLWIRMHEAVDVERL
ncbi:cytochrome P450 monooxygenase pc-1 [Auricularia subglabra TFB-10046 SS5]|uniref:Cytochrome P450 monooxygenase pc-1 n=1 Tax=Auricularia subglabra (strain TFB-10046 / SS5) TaxID=717982 RepID=J0D825_AURST|nr:cytochrome P450 monooxygenase pc-1 [Auricularia subglabra TFB-10046 SS5]